MATVQEKFDRVREQLVEWLVEERQGITQDDIRQLFVEQGLDPDTDYSPTASLFPYDDEDADLQALMNYADYSLLTSAESIFETLELISAAPSLSSIFSTSSILSTSSNPSNLSSVSTSSSSLSSSLPQCPCCSRWPFSSSEESSLSGVESSLSGAESSLSGAESSLSDSADSGDTISSISTEPLSVYEDAESDLGFPTCDVCKEEILDDETEQLKCCRCQKVFHRHGCSLSYSNEVFQRFLEEGNYNCPSCQVSFVPYY